MRQSLGLALVVCSVVSQAGAQQTPTGPGHGPEEPGSVAVTPPRARSTSRSSASSTRTATAPSWDRTARPCRSPRGSTIPRASSLSAWLFVADKNASGGSTPRARRRSSLRPRRFPRRRCSSTTSPSIRERHALCQRFGRPQGQGRGGLPHLAEGRGEPGPRKQRAGPRTRPTACCSTGRRICCWSISAPASCTASSWPTARREDRRRLRRRRRPGLGQLRPAVRHRLEGRQGLRHPASRRQAGAAAPRASDPPPTVPRCRPARTILVPDMKAGTVTALPITVPGCGGRRRRCRCKTAVAFPELKWTGWKGETEAGKVRSAAAHRADPRRRRQQPRLRRHRAGRHPRLPQRSEGRRRRRSSSTSRTASATTTTQNEEGFLGLAFHPKYKENGEFFVFYTPKTAKLTNVVSRFRVSKDDPNRADPASEEVLLRVRASRSGTTTAARSASARTATCTSRSATAALANDPYDNGQNLEDPARQGPAHRRGPQGRGGKNYAIPKDNPFVGSRTPARRSGRTGCATSGAWRSTARPGKLWAADVGQNLYEEIDIIEQGRQLRLEPPRGAAPVRRQRRRPQART